MLSALTLWSKNFHALDQDSQGSDSTKTLILAAFLLVGIGALGFLTYHFFHSQDRAGNYVLFSHSPGCTCGLCAIAMPK